MRAVSATIRHPLESFADIQYGFTAKACAEPVGPKFLRITDIQAGAVDWSTVPFCEATKAEHQKFALSPGEIVFARTGATTGKSCLINDDVDAVFASYLIRVKPLGKDVCSQYLAYYFQTDEYWAEIAAGTEGAAQGGFNASKLGRLRVPIPSLEEQKRIVAVLDQAFAALDRARAHAEANLADARELLDVELVDIFNRVDGNDIHSISSVFTTATGATPPKSNEALYGEDIRFVKPPELLNGVVDETRDGLSEAARPKARLAPAGAVLVSCIGNLGKVGLLDRESAFNQQINAILPNAKIARPDFIYWQCRSRPFRDQLEARASGTTIPIVNKKLFNSISVWLPPLGEQDTVSNRLGDAERSVIALRHLYEVKLKDLGTLRQSLLQKAFSGELT